MPMITIDDVEYDTDTLSDDAKNQLQMMQLADQELGRLQVQLAMAQTARGAYAFALKHALPKAD